MAVSLPGPWASSLVNKDAPHSPRTFPSLGSQSIPRLSCMPPPLVLPLEVAFPER